MDKYFIASQLSFFGTPEYLAADQAPGAKDARAARLAVAAIAPLSGEALMFAYWDPPATFRGRVRDARLRHKARLNTAAER